MIIQLPLSYGQDSVSANQPLNLETCRQLALEANKNILISGEKIKEARELKRAALTQFLPNVSANGMYMKNSKNISLLSADAYLPIGTVMADGSFGFTMDQINNKVTMVDGQYALLDADGNLFNPKTEPDKIQWKQYAYLPKESMEFDMKNVYAGKIGFVQPVFMGGKIRELYRLARSTESLADIQYDSERQELIQEVDEAYWRVVSLESKFNLAEQYCELLNKLEHDVSAMLDEGVATKGDYLKVKVKLNEAEMTKTKAENGLSLSRMALFQLCGLDINGSYKIADNDPGEQMPMTDEIITDGTMDEVLARRPEIQMLEEMNKMAGYSTNIAKSRFMPNIALEGGIMASNPNIFNGFSNKFSSMYNVGVVVSMPITHFGERIHTLNAAKSKQRQARYQLDEAKEKIELQVNQCTFRINEANKNLIKANSNIDNAEENLRFANDSFQEGMISPAELMEAQTAWLSAYSDKIDAGIDVKLCKLYLDKARGILK